MHLIYIDESMDGNFGVMSALVIPAVQWWDSLALLKAHRRALNSQYGLYVRKEIHARDFVAGRGKVGSRMVPKGLRCRLFNEMLVQITRLPDAMLFNAVFTKDKQEMAFGDLITRFDRMMVHLDSHALLICDVGKEAIYIPLSRKLRVYNPIPSQFGSWGGVGGTTKSIPTIRLVEDPLFIRSDQSFFIQAVDCCAYALLRKEKPLASKTRYGLHQSFDLLDPILVKKATKYDPQGILRRV